MRSTSTFSLPRLGGSLAGPSEPVSVSLVNLLGARVSVHGALAVPEHARRQSIGMTAVTDPALLGRLLEIPTGVPIINPALWAEIACQPAGIVTRGDDGYTVTRLLVPALVVLDVIVSAGLGREVLAVQQASLFEGFAARWVRVKAEPRDAAVMEAKLCGVGLIEAEGGVILPAERPNLPVVDGWAWLLWEKAYRRWLKERSLGHARESRAQATGAASAKPTGLPRARRATRQCRPLTCTIPTRRPSVRLSQTPFSPRAHGKPYCDGRPAFVRPSGRPRTCGQGAGG